jgi:hypothetical protein
VFYYLNLLKLGGSVTNLLMQDGSLNGLKLLKDAAAAAPAAVGEGRLSKRGVIVSSS